MNSLQPFDWKYPAADPFTTDRIRQKLESAAASKCGDPLTYSDIVRDIEFTLPGGRKHTIIVHNWSSFDRTLIAEHLGYIATETFRDHGFMLSALAVDAHEMRASSGFFNLARKLKALSTTSEEEELAFWTAQMEKSREFYSEYQEEFSLEEFIDYQRLVIEGIKQNSVTPHRKRCEMIRRHAKEHYRGPDGLIRCAACRWSKPNGIEMDIVEFHHRNHLAHAPKEGCRLTLKAAIAGLVPLCPNCHRIAHTKSTTESYTLEELKAFAAPQP